MLLPLKMMEVSQQRRARYRQHGGILVGPLSPNTPPAIPQRDAGQKR